MAKDDLAATEGEQTDAPAAEAVAQPQEQVAAKAAAPVEALAEAPAEDEDDPPAADEPAEEDDAASTDDEEVMGEGAGAAEASDLVGSILVLKAFRDKGRIVHPGETITTDLQRQRALARNGLVPYPPGEAPAKPEVSGPRALTNARVNERRRPLL